MRSPTLRTAAVWGLLLLVLIVGALVRGYRIGAKSLWLDETATMKLIRQPWWEMMGVITAREAHPPLYYVVARLWTGASHNGVRARALSAAASIGTLVVFFLLARVLLGAPWAVVATGLLAASSLDVFFAQEARLYALATFLVTAGWYLLVELAAGKRLARWPLWAGLALANTAALYTFYYTAFAVAMQFVVLLLMVRGVGRRLLLPWLVWLLVPACVFGLYVPVIQARLATLAPLTPPMRYSVASVAGLAATASKFVSGMLPALSGRFGAVSSGVAIALALLALALGALALRRRWLAAAVGLLWLLGPVACLAVVSLKFRGHTYEPKHLIFAAPALALVVGAGLSASRGKVRLAGIVLAALLVGVNVLSLALYYRRGVEKENWRDAVSAMTEHVKPGDLVVFNPPHASLPFEFYYGGPPVVLRGAPLAGRAFRVEPLMRERRAWVVELTSNVAIPNPTVAKALEAYPKLFHQRYQDLLGTIDVRLYDTLKPPQAEADAP